MFKKKTKEKEEVKEEIKERVEERDSSIPESKQRHLRG